MSKKFANRVTAVTAKTEAQVKIPVKNEGILEVPEGKKVDELDEGHFMKLIEKHGFEAISKALVNLVVWNKNKNPALSKWADGMQEKLAAKVEKREGSVDESEVTEAKAAHYLSDAMVDVFSDAYKGLRKPLSDKAVQKNLRDIEATYKDAAAYLKKLTQLSEKDKIEDMAKRLGGSLTFLLTALGETVKTIDETAE